jgi:hypothetical protein
VVDAACVSPNEPRSQCQHQIVAVLEDRSVQYVPINARNWERPVAAALSVSGVVFAVQRVGSIRLDSGHNAVASSWW